MDLTVERDPPDSPRRLAGRSREKGAPMPVLRSPRRQARAAVALAAGAVVLPGMVQAVSGTRVGAREIVAVEFAGSGERLMALAQGRRERLEVHRSLLGARDDGYVAIYSVPLLLGVDLLPAPARRVGLLLALGTAAADVVENHALEQSCKVLLADPAKPERADAAARLARRAATVKFALLVPAASMGLRGVARTWRTPVDCVGRECR
jgi:hypothetical protein